MAQSRVPGTELVRDESPLLGDIVMFGEAATGR